jgi:hypothetical protein
MGREATVQCQWAEESGLCKVLLESHELIVRGGLRRRVPISSLKDVTVEDERLRFHVGDESVSFSLGSELAQRWAKAIATPPPSVAMKLGISRASRLLLLGEIEGDELRNAIAEAGAVDGKNADLIVAAVKARHDLELVLRQLCDRLPKRQSELPPLWIVYPKGSVNNFGESSVRQILRLRGFMDTKVASVSPELTALRFIKREA